MDKLQKIVRKLKSALLFQLKGRNMRNLDFLAVSGSNGKTTTVHLLAHILSAKSPDIGVISSIGSFMGGKIINNIPVEKLDTGMLYDILELMYKSKITLVILEVTPSLISTGVISHLRFEATVLTNIITEGDPSSDPATAAYAEQWFLPLVSTREHGVAILNGDERNIAWVNHRAEKLPQKLYAAWCRLDQLRNVQIGFSGSQFELESVRFETKLVGRQNLLNVLLATRYALQVMPLTEIAAQVHTFAPLAGRMQVLQEQPFRVIVDACSRVAEMQPMLHSLASLKSEQNRIIVVAGTDSQENARLGYYLAADANIVILAPLNPGNNDLAKINSSIAAAGEPKSAVVVERFTSAEEYMMVDKQNLAQKIERVLQNQDKPVISTYYPHILMGPRQLSILLLR